jgi:hypothetical protein
MAVIRKKIENLKIGKEYIATVRAKNTDLNTYSDYTDSIRFIVPSDSTIPEVLQNFKLYASYKNVMFVFDNSTERDVVAYEYELYHQDDITGPEPFEINSGADPIISGVGYSNVIAVPLTEDYIQGYSDINTRVDGDGNEIIVYYYGRVRAIDSSNNIGDWTPIRESESTKLIDDQFIVNLTASKITAGTIKASEIILAQAGASTTVTTPANVSILRSANYNGTYNPSTSSWTAGTQGWVVAGTGYAEFDSAVIRGGLKAGSVFINTNNRWNADTSGNPYASGNVNLGYFKAGSSSKYVEWNPVTDTLNIAGNLVGATGNFTGSITIGTGNAVFKADTNGIYLGNATFASAPFRVDLSGNLTANNATLTNATVSGNVTANAVSLLNGDFWFSNSFRLGGANGITYSGGTVNIGSNVVISGTLTASAVSINTNNFWNATGTFRVGDASKFMQWDGTNLTVTGRVLSTGTGGRVEFGATTNSDNRTIRFIGGNGGVVTLRNPEGETGETGSFLRITVGSRTYAFRETLFETISDITTSGTLTVRRDINGAGRLEGATFIPSNLTLTGNITANGYVVPNSNPPVTVASNMTLNGNISLGGRLNGAFFSQTAEGHVRVETGLLGTMLKILDSTDGAQIRNGFDNAFHAIRASAFNVGSSIEIKEDLEIFDGALEKLLSINVQKWKYKDDIKNEIHIFPIAEYLPDYLLNQELSGDKVVDLRDTIGFLWRAIQELVSKFDTRIDKIEKYLGDINE